MSWTVPIDRDAHDARRSIPVRLEAGCGRSFVWAGGARRSRRAAGRSAGRKPGADWDRKHQSGVSAVECCQIAHLLARQAVSEPDPGEERRNTVDEQPTDEDPGRRSELDQPFAPFAHDALRDDLPRPHGEPTDAPIERRRRRPSPHHDVQDEAREHASIDSDKDVRRV